MNLTDCYRLLGLNSEASTAEIKRSYRRLARKYHPDINGDNQQAHAKFIELHEAYKLLLSAVNTAGILAAETASQTQKQETNVSWQQPRVKKVVRVSNENEQQNPPDLSLSELQIKWSAYKQLQQLLKSRKFARAIALAEALAQRFPQDPEVRQWNAIAYSSWGRQLVSDRQLDKARIYLKKALRTDPHNRSLWIEVERDFRRIEQML
jgi:curved DNA-binding protein CbpA